MSSFSRVLGGAVVALALVAPLAACTGLRPVYSDAGLGTQRIDVAYASPSNRLEQIIYQDLALRLGQAAGTVPVVRISASSRTATLASSSPSTPRQVTVSAALTVTSADGKVLFSGTRSQTADYTTDAQALSSQQALISAERQAALLLADTLRLQIIAALAK